MYQYDDLYEKISISEYDFIDEVVSEDDPVVDYAIKRLTKRDKEIDFNNLKLETVLTYIKVMESINENYNASPEDIVDRSPREIRKYVAFIVSNYKGKYFDEDIMSVGMEDSGIPGQAEYI